MIRLVLILVVIISFGTITSKSLGQVRYISNGKGSIFAGVGTATYFGDLKTSMVSLDFSPALTVGGAYYFRSPDRLSVRGEATYYRISASDSDASERARLERNLSFEASNFEFNASAVFSLFSEPIISPYTKSVSRRPYNAYAFLGIGVTSVNPTAELNGTKYNLPEQQTELVEYSTISLVVPGGLGLKYKLSSDLAILLEAGYRLTFTDYMDDVSTTYPGQDAFASRTAAALSDRGPEVGIEPKPAGASRGNPDRNDHYAIISIKIEYLSLTNIFGGGNPYEIDRTKAPRSRPSQ